MATGPECRRRPEFGKGEAFRHGICRFEKELNTAQENDDPMDLDDGATSTCSYGTSNVCYEKTTTITICNAFRPISVDGSINPGRGGGVGVKLECSESEIKETKETRYWSK